jgi:ethanolamine ammonia-lyase small subunit
MGDDPSPAERLAAVSGGLDRLRRFTPARIRLGRAGSGQSTAAALKFLLDHANARDAVHIPLDFGVLEADLRAAGWNVLHVRSAANDRAEYLRRPDLGRRLAQTSRALLESQAGGSDVVIAAVDGLSSTAVASHLVALLAQLRPRLLARRAALGPLVLVEQGRVAIGDEIGESLRAKLVVVLIGERPGLSAADSLGAYITWRPRVGTMDSARNCISNIRPAGLPLDDAADQIDALIGLALTHAATGVALSDLRTAT